MDPICYDRPVYRNRCLYAGFTMRGNAAIILFILASLLLLTPNSETRAMSNSRAISGGFGNPDSWFKAIKEKIAVPIPTSSQKILESPGKTLKSVSAKVKKINNVIKREIGIDFAVFFGWLAKILDYLFKIIVKLLQNIATALK